jgi:RNA polymerase sigma factor (sigma-70 family)
VSNLPIRQVKAFDKSPEKKERETSVHLLKVDQKRTGKFKGDLVCKGGKGDKNALIADKFWVAWNSHRDYLLRLSMMWMNISRMDAEDALSDATIRAYEKYRIHVDQINNERAWFARLLHNICIDRHRSNKRRFQLGEKVKEVNSIDQVSVEVIDMTPEAELLNSELGKTLEKAVGELPVKLRDPLVMRLVHGDDYEHIACVMGISNDNARKRVQQARSILRRELADFRRK